MLHDVAHTSASLPPHEVRASPATLAALGVDCYAPDLLVAGALPCWAAPEAGLPPGAVALPAWMCDAVGVHSGGQVHVGTRSGGSARLARIDLDVLDSLAGDALPASGNVVAAALRRQLPGLRPGVGDLIAVRLLSGVVALRVRALEAGAEPAGTAASSGGTVGAVDAETMISLRPAAAAAAVGRPETPFATSLEAAASSGAAPGEGRGSDGGGARGRAVVERMWAEVEARLPPAKRAEGEEERAMRAHAARGRHLLLTGPPGAGKGRALRALCRRAAEMRKREIMTERIRNIA